MASPTYRALLPPLATELSKANTVTLAASKTSTVPTIVPEAANGRPIIGIKLIATASVTFSNEPSGTVGTVGGLMSELKILKAGNVTLLDPETYAQLQRLYHIYTGLELSDQNITGAGSAYTLTATLETEVMPFYFTTGVTPQFIFYAAGYGQFANATSGSLTVQIEFHYGGLNLVNDDQVVIVTTPTALSNGVEVSVNPYFTVKTPVNQVWFDATADADLGYQSYEAGNSVIFDKVDADTLTNLEGYLPYFDHINGFFFSQTPSGVLYPSPGTTQGSTAPNLIVYLNDSISLTFYLVVAATNPPT